MRDYLDLLDTLLMDTYLSVKMEKEDGKTVFVHYIIPIARKDGSERAYTDLYTYFTNKKGFRFAIGYILEEEGECWKAQKQYFYFSKEELPYLKSGILKNPLFHLKAK